MIDRILRTIAKIFEWIGIVLTAGCASLSIITVLLRYLFNIAFVQTEELITFLFIGIVFLGAIPVMQRGEHVCVTLIQDSVPAKARRVIEILVDIIVTGLQVFLVIVSIRWISKTYMMKTPGLRISTAFVYCVIPIGAFFTGLYSFFDIVKKLIPGKKEG